MLARCLLLAVLVALAMPGVAGRGHVPLPTIQAQENTGRAACAVPPGTEARAESAAEPIRVPFKLSNNHVYVTVCVGTRALDFVLDTGAGASLFDLGIARDLGLEFGSSFRARGAGAGTAAGAAVRDGAIRVAGTTLDVPIRSAIDFSGLTPREGRRIEGILGADFIGRFVLVLDYRAGQLRLHQPSRAPEGDGFVPITFSANHPLVQAEIGLADGTRLNGTFIVDVGSSLALALTQPFVEGHRLRDRVGPTMVRPAGGGIGGPSTAAQGRLASLRIGDVELTNVVTDLFGADAGVFSGNRSWIGNIGGEILRRFVVWFDYPRGRMRLEPHAGTSELFEADMSGLVLIDDGRSSRIHVDFVVPGSAADEAGLRRGDVLSAIDGRPVGVRTLVELRPRLRREGVTVTLTVERDGTVAVYRLVTRRII